MRTAKRGNKQKQQMKHHSNMSFYILTDLLLVGTCFLGQAQTVPVVFTIDAVRSQIVLSGSITAAGFVSVPIVQQGPGSLVASYDGTLNAVMDNQSIEFTGASTIVARITGNWQPASGGTSGSHPANYGARAEVRLPFGSKVSAVAALRGIVLDLSSPPLPVVSGGFDTSALVVSFSADNAGSLDFSDDFGDSGAFPLVGSVNNAASTAATLSAANGIQELVMPLDVVSPVNSGQLAGSEIHLVGQIKATRPLVPPMIRSILVTNQTVVLMVAYATPHSQVEASSDLVAWWPVRAETGTDADLTVFSTASTSEQRFFRVRQ